MRSAGLLAMEAAHSRLGDGRGAFVSISGLAGRQGPTVSMARIVMKFGGTSVADLDRIHNVARHVKREVDAGHEVAVVVSAMSGKTNELVGWVQHAEARRRHATMRANMTPSSPPASR